MVYSNQNAAFRRDKHQFFSQMSSANDLKQQMKTADIQAQATEYSFLLKNHRALELEFTELFQLLQKQENNSKDEFWLYCYYCASLLEHFHRAYGQFSKEAYYKDIRKQIKKRLNKETLIEEEEQGFIQSLYHSFLTSYRDFLSAPSHLGKIRDYIAYANLCRIYWVFCRLTLTQGLTIAKDMQMIDKLDAILGTHTNVDKVIATIQAPTGVINYFSVGLFLARFMIDAGLLIKHTFFPSEAEKGAEQGCEVNKMARLPGAASIEHYRASYLLIEEEEETLLFYVPKQGKPIKLEIQGTLNTLKEHLKLKKTVRLSAAERYSAITQPTGHLPETTTRFERFKYELSKRHRNFANDLTWATVNFLCNFNHVVGISGPVAGYLTAVFLAFDVAMALYSCQLAKKEFLAKKAQFLEELAQYTDPNQCLELDNEERIAHVALLNQQLFELELNWKTKKATFYFVAAAAIILMSGFSLSLMISAPLLIAATFFACLVGIAMYMSAGAYANYKEKSLRLEEAQLRGERLEMSVKEYQVARHDFIFTMIKNTIVPTLLIATYAVCWPAALALTAVYLGYELVHAYQKHSGAKAVKELALATPQEEPEAEFELSSLSFSGRK